MRSLFWIILVIIVAGGWYWLSSRSAVDTSDWETYTNERVGFSIKYPSDFGLNTSDPLSAQFVLFGPTQSIGTELYDGVSMNVAYAEYGGGFQKFVEDQVEESKQHGEIKEVLAPASLAGRSGFRYVSSGLGEFTHYYLPIDGTHHLYVSYLVSDPGDSGFEELVKGMLESLAIG